MIKLGKPTSELVNSIINGTCPIHVMEQWEKAFEIYNTENKVKKSMNCRPCYGLVFFYLVVNKKLAEEV